MFSDGRAARVLLAVALCCFAAAAPPEAAQTAGPYSFSALSPCRAADTRRPNGLNGGPPLGGNAQPPRNFLMQGNCGVPVGAAAVAINVTVLQPGVGGFLTIWPSGGTQPIVSTINFTPNEVIANGTIVPVSTNTTSGDLSVFFGGENSTVHVLIDVTGYFR
jgi:hypothetical protein